MATWKDFRKDGKLSQKITLPLYDSAGQSIAYAGKLKDPATDNFIINKGLDLELFPIVTDDFNKGQFVLGIVRDDPQSGYIDTNVVPL